MRIKQKEAQETRLSMADSPSDGLPVFNQAEPQFDAEA